MKVKHCPSIPLSPLCSMYLFIKKKKKKQSHKGSPSLKVLRGLRKLSPVPALISATFTIGTVKGSAFGFHPI